MSTNKADLVINDLSQKIKNLESFVSTLEEKIEARIIQKFKDTNFKFLEYQNKFEDLTFQLNSLKVKHSSLDKSSEEMKERLIRQEVAAKNNEVLINNSIKSIKRDIKENLTLSFELTQNKEFKTISDVLTVFY